MRFAPLGRGGIGGESRSYDDGGVGVLVSCSRRRDGGCCSGRGAWRCRRRAAPVHESCRIETEREQMDQEKSIASVL